MRDVRRLLVATLLVASLGAGCGTTSPSVGPSTPSVPWIPPVATSTAIAEETEPGSTDFSSSELCPGGTGNLCRLTAGEHHSLGFGDGITYTLDGPWIVRANETDVISLESGLASHPMFLELITGAIRFQDPVTAEMTPVIDPAEARARIAAIVTVGDSKTKVIDRGSMALAGAPATVFDVTNGYGARMFSYPVTDHASTLARGRTVRFIWSTWAGAPLIVSIESDTSNLRTFLEQVQPILDSLELGDED